MKKEFVFLALLCITTVFGYSQIGMGTNEPDESSILELKSTNRGFLVPRLSTEEQESIENPANGLLIYNNECNEFRFNRGTSVSPEWVKINDENPSLKYNNGENRGISIGINSRLISTMEWNTDPELYKVDTRTHSITVNQKGLYRIIANISLSNANPDESEVVSAKIMVNGIATQSQHIESFGTFYSSSPDLVVRVNEGSIHIHKILELDTNDSVSIQFNYLSPRFDILSFKSNNSSNIFIERLLCITD